MENDEIISFLRTQKANNPEEYERYITYYKEKYPDFYKNTILPALETVPKPQQPPAPQKVNPSDMFGSEVAPLGSANVGEVSFEGEAKKPEAAAEQPTSTIKRSNRNLVFIIIGAAVVVIAVVVAAVYFLM